MPRISPQSLRQRLLQEIWRSKTREPFTIYLTECIGCPRKLYLNLLLNAAPKPRPIMVLGRLLHEAMYKIIAKALQDEVVEVAVEPVYKYPLDDTWTLVAEPDLVVKFKDGDVVVIEIKTTKIEKKVAEALYYAQLKAYLYLVDASVGYLVILDRETFDIEVLEVPKDDSCRILFENCVKVAKEVLNYLRNEVLPPGPKFNFECNMCVYRSICKHIPKTSSQLS